MRLIALLALLALVAGCAIGEIRVRLARNRAAPYYRFAHRWIEWFLGSGSITFAGTIWSADYVLQQSEHAHEWVHWQEEQRLGFTRHKLRWCYYAARGFLKHGLARDKITGFTGGGKEISVRVYRWYALIPEEALADAYEVNAPRFRKVEVEKAA